MNRFSPFVISLLISIVISLNLPAQTSSNSLPNQSAHQITLPDSLYPFVQMPDTANNVKFVMKYYPKRILHFKANPLQMKDIVFVGNSITEFGKEWGKRFGNPTIKNRGIAGDGTEGVLQRLDEICYVKPLAVFLLIGINDIFHNKSPEFIANNIVKITNKIHLKSPKTLIFVQTILPISKENLVQKILDTNALIRTNAKSNSYTVVELHKLFADENNLIKKELSYDGTHLTELGYKVWVDAEKSIVGDLIEKRY